MKTRNVAQVIRGLLSGPEFENQINSLPVFLFPSFNLLLETRPDSFTPVTILFSPSGEVRLKSGFDFSLDLSIRATAGTWEEILAGRATLLSEFFHGRVRFRNQRTAWSRFCLLSYFLAKK